MKIRWSPEATDDFSKLLSTSASRIQSAVERSARTIFNGISPLESFPERDRPGRVKDTRELVLAPLPFVVVYRVRGFAIEVAPVLHGSQHWP